MFPKSVQTLVDMSTPHINRVLGDGLAFLHIKQVEEYVDSIFKSAARSYPPGMLYLGCRRCTPQEEYYNITKKKGSKCVYDVARSDVYLMEYKFSYLDEPLPSKYLLLPFVSDAGIIYLGGSRFVISPILADRVISVGLYNVFVRLLKARLTFNRTAHHYMVNGVRESVRVAWSDIYNEKVTEKATLKTVKANCALVHYLFCKYGFTYTFNTFGNCNPIIGSIDTINENDYPKEDWVICYSSCYMSLIKPKGFGRSHYEPSHICLAIRRNEFTPMVKNLVGGFFYCVDFFPTHIKPEYVDSRELWMYLLGHIIWTGTINRGKLVNDVTDHIASLDEYVDGIVTDKLRDIGYECNDIYQIFALIIDKFNDWSLSSDDRVNTMYDKELSILYYICYEITSAIFKLSFKLKAAQKKDINKNKIISIMNKNLKPGLIFKINKDHGEVTTTPTSGDNKALKTTMLLVPQSSSARSRSKRDRLSLTDPTKRLNASITEIGAHSALPKSEPTGRSRLNLCVNISPTGLVLRNPKYVELIDGVQDLIRR